jgi:hypothetical protein
MIAIFDIEMRQVRMYLCRIQFSRSTLHTEDSFGV